MLLKWWNMLSVKLCHNCVRSAQQITEVKVNTVPPAEGMDERMTDLSNWRAGSLFQDQWSRSVELLQQAATQWGGAIGSCPYNLWYILSSCIYCY